MCVNLKYWSNKQNPSLNLAWIKITSCNYGISKIRRKYIHKVQLRPFKTQLLPPATGGKSCVLSSCTMYVVDFKPDLVCVPRKMTSSMITNKINIFANLFVKILINFRGLCQTCFGTDFKFSLEILLFEHYILIVLWKKLILVRWNLSGEVSSFWKNDKKLW